MTFRDTQGNRENQVLISSLQNSELTWEKQYETNVGVDMGFLRNRISLSADAYFRNGFDLIGYMRTSGIGGEAMKAAELCRYEIPWCGIYFKHEEYRYEEF